MGAQSWGLPSFHRRRRIVSAARDYFFTAIMSPPAQTQLASFPLTRWSLIRQVQKGNQVDAAKAMEELCRQYWYPIYAFARHQGFSAHDAEDLTQVFFQRLITSETIQAARQERGLMRTFMLSLLKHVISNHIRHATAQKRGGTHATIDFDSLDAEARYAHEPADRIDTATLFDRAWARSVLVAAEKKLRLCFEEAQNLDGYEQLREFLPLGANVTPYATVAERLRITEATLRLQIHRMRKRYARLIEQEIELTVSHPTDVKAELEHLMAVIGG